MQLSQLMHAVRSACTPVFLGKSFKITFLDMSYRIVLELCTILIFCIYAHKVAHISDVVMLYNTFKVYKQMLFYS